MKTKTLTKPEPQPVVEVPPTTRAVANLDFLYGPVAELPEVPNTGDGVPYVGNAGTKSGKWEECREAGLREGDLYLMIEGQIIKKMPLEYFLLSADKWFTKLDTSGKVVAATQDEEVAGRFGCQEHYTTILLIKHGEQLIPSRSDFRTTKAGNVVGAIRAVQRASTPAWGDVSEAAKVSMAFPHAWGRVIHSATTSQRTSKSGPGQGMKYFVGKVSSRPVTVDEMRLVKEALDDQETLQRLTDARASQESRIEEFRAVLVR